MCDMDCFNCPYPDCINNADETEEERKMRECGSTQNQSYYLQNRERIIAKQKEYNRIHNEERREYYRKYYAEHREEHCKRERERAKRKRLTDKDWAQRQRDKARENYYKRKYANA